MKSDTINDFFIIILHVNFFERTIERRFEPIICVRSNCDCGINGYAIYWYFIVEFFVDLFVQFLAVIFR